MPRYTQWVWSEAHRRHYSYLLADDGRTILDTILSGPASPAVETGISLSASPQTVAASAQHKATDSRLNSSHLQQTTEDHADSGYISSSIPSAPLFRTHGTPKSSAGAGKSESSAGHTGYYNQTYSSSGAGLSVAGFTVDGIGHTSGSEEEEDDGPDKDRNTNTGSGSANNDQEDEENEEEEEVEGAKGAENDTDIVTPTEAIGNIGKGKQKLRDSGSAAPYEMIQAISIGSPQTSYSDQSSATPWTRTTSSGSRIKYSQSSFSSSQPPAQGTTSDLNVLSRSTVSNLPADVQAHIAFLERRYIRASSDTNDVELLDPRYRRVKKPLWPYFFIPGRVFKMLWTEPAGQANRGKARHSSHFSTVWLGEHAYSEIRYFVVVRHKGTFSQCIPIQTYKHRGTTKPGVIAADHGVIHTSLEAPSLILGEQLTKYSVRVEPTEGEILEPESRVNYGKAYAVEHNVKVLDIGMVVEGHRYLIEMYFRAAMGG